MVPTPPGLFAAHGWFPHCKKGDSLAEATAGKFEDKDVTALNVLAESAGGQPPTAAGCKSWRTKYGHSRVVTLCANNYTYGVTTCSNYAALSVFMDKDRVIVSKTHTEVQSQLDAAIDNALAQ